MSKRQKSKNLEQKASIRSRVLMENKIIDLNLGSLKKKCHKASQLYDMLNFLTYMLYSKSNIALFIVFMEK